jgi:hypothetical protein
MRFEIRYGCNGGGAVNAKEHFFVRCSHSVVFHVCLVSGVGVFGLRYTSVELGWLALLHKHTQHAQLRSLLYVFLTDK